MDYKIKGTIKGNIVILENEIPVHGRVTVIIQENDKSISLKSILSYLKEKFPDWKKSYGIEKIGIFGSFARSEQTSESDIDIILKFADNPKDIFNSKNKIRESIEEEFNKKVDLANELYLKPNAREQILKEAIYVVE